MLSGYKLEPEETGCPRAETLSKITPSRFLLLVPNSFLLLLVRHLFLVAMHLFLVAYCFKQNHTQPTNFSTRSSAEHY